MSEAAYQNVNIIRRIWAVRRHSVGRHSLDSYHSHLQAIKWPLQEDIMLNFANRHRIYESLVHEDKKVDQRHNIFGHQKRHFDVQFTFSINIIFFLYKGAL